MPEDCTAISSVSLNEVTKRINIGREEFWGTASTTWVALFYVQCIVFITLFAITVCWCGLFLWEKLQSWRRNYSLLYLLFVYCMMWSLTSLLQYILLAINVSSPPNQNLAAATYSIEIIAFATSMNGLLILAVYQYYRLIFQVYQSLKKCVLFTGPSLVIAITVVAIILTSVGSVAIMPLVIMILILAFIGIMGTTSLVAIYTKLWLRNKSSQSLEGSIGGKKLIRRLIFRLISYIYLMMVPVHLLVPFIELAANSDCIEEAQGNRTIWLSLQTAIKLAELFLVIQCLNVPQKVQRLFRNLRPQKPAKSSVDVTPKNVTKVLLNDIEDPFNSGGTLPTKSIASDKNKAHDLLEAARLESDSPKHDLLEVMQYSRGPRSTKSPCQLAECIGIPFITAVEKEILSQASNNNIDDEFKEQSYSNNKMMLSEKVECEFQDNQLLCSIFDELNSQFNHDLYYTPSPIDVLSVEIVSAHIPVDTENLVGDIEGGMFDERGGVFHSQKHGVTVLFPAGAIPSGILAELKFAATLAAPVKLLSNKTPVSAMYWLCMDIILQKPIQVRLPHFVNIENEAQTRSLQFLKSIHSPVGITEETMSNIIEGEFPTGESYGSIEVNHFCYYCIVEDKLDYSKIPCNRYVAVAMKQRQPRHRLWNVHICILPLLKTCIEKLKEQYGHDWKYESLKELSFPQGCEQVRIELKNHQFQGEAMVEILTDDKINQKDIDFQHYYGKDESVLNQLRLLMDEKLYPPRFKAIVQAKNKDFFESSNCLYYQLICGAEITKGKLIVPGRASTDTCASSVSSSESVCSLKINKNGSNTSGYESIEHLSDEDDLNSSKLQLRNLMVQTMVIKSKWFELGMALCIPIDKLERLYDKYNDIPVKALVRVFRYWLADKNGLRPTWEKLIAALQDIKEYNLAIGLQKSIPTDPHQYPTVFHDNDIEPEKELVMKHVRLELLNLTALIPVLNKHGLLTLNDNYKLLNYLVSPSERANALLYCIIPSKGVGAFKKFITCLQEETEHIGHQELVKILLSSMKTTTKAMETTV